MDKYQFFPVLRDALVAQPRRHGEFAKKAGITIAGLGDLWRYEDEWRVAIELGTLRSLCGLLDIDFNRHFSVPLCDEQFKERFLAKLVEQLPQLRQQLSGHDALYEYLRSDVEVLKIYPFDWTEELADALGFDVGSVLSLLWER